MGYLLEGHKVRLSLWQTRSTQLVNLFGRFVQQLLELLVFGRIVAVDAIDQSLKVLIFNGPRCDHIVLGGHSFFEPIEDGRFKTLVCITKFDISIETYRCLRSFSFLISSLSVSSLLCCAWRSSSRSRLVLGIIGSISKTRNI